jgi:sirohydrochlorin ferrochelatase
MSESKPACSGNAVILARKLVELERLCPPAEQVRICKKHCRANGWKVVDTVYDGAGATLATDIQPERLRYAVDKARVHRAKLVMIDDAKLFDSGPKSREIGGDFVAAQLDIVLVDGDTLRSDGTPVSQKWAGTAVILAREAIEQESGISQRAQVKMCRALCKERQWEVALVCYVGPQPADRRKALTEAVDCALANDAKLVVVDDTDLFSGGRAFQKIWDDVRELELEVVVVDQSKLRRKRVG